MKLYFSKHFFLNSIFGLPKDICIPINDYDAYKYYINFRHLYNKKWIANSQNIKNGLSNYNISLVPDKIIVRPIINLSGMGKGAYFTTRDKITDIPDKSFWCDILIGDHISADIFYNSFGIQGYVVFKGIPDDGFKFEHWEYLPGYKLANNITNWIEKHLMGFKGVFNLEIIGDNIIECHLRMGDMNYFQDINLCQALVDCKLDKKIELPELNKIYLIPVFVDKGDYKQLKKEDIFFAIRVTNNIENIHNYLIDRSPDKSSNPSGGDRICNFTVYDYNKGVELREFILKYHRRC